MELNKLRDNAYKNAVNHGWHSEELSNEHFLWLVITELSEATEADRKGKRADVDKFNRGIELRMKEIDIHGDSINYDFIDLFELCIKDSVEDEMADACIRLLDLAGLRDIDLDDYEYSESDTYSDVNFTESMFYISEKIVDEWYDDLTLQFKIPDVLNEIFSFCKSREIDIMFHIEQKMKFNSLRPYKHGDKKY